MKKQLVIFFAFLIIVAMDSVYILDQRQSAIILQFGEPINKEMQPGLKWKIPFINKAISISA